MIKTFSILFCSIPIFICFPIHYNNFTLKIHEYSQCSKWFIPYRITMGKDVKCLIKNFNEEKVISLSSDFLEVHVCITTMRQGAESKDYFL
ncbi:hypothetical protein COD09_23755 [Bacillus cereus]|uniref:Uncharacterized protein n=1 Tax=Bacillus cereus TaxID=1396 RepID=A0A2C1D5H5_BACCE|nr:hypothetical protein COD09_23755 [Bacillus cereus]